MKTTTEQERFDAGLLLVNLNDAVDWELWFYADIVCGPPMGFGNCLQAQQVAEELERRELI